MWAYRPLRAVPGRQRSVRDDQFPASISKSATTGGHWFFGTLDLNQLRLTKSRYAINQSPGLPAENPPPRLPHRLPPLSHPQLLVDSGVAQGSRADFASDHLPELSPIRNVSSTLSSWDQRNLSPSVRSRPCGPQDSTKRNNAHGRWRPAEPRRLVVLVDDVPLVVDRSEIICRGEDLRR